MHGIVLGYGDTSMMMPDPRSQQKVRKTASSPNSTIQRKVYAAVALPSSE